MNPIRESAGPAIQSTTAAVTTGRCPVSPHRLASEVAAPRGASGAEARAVELALEQASTFLTSLGDPLAVLERLRIEQRDLCAGREAVEIHDKQARLDHAEKARRAAIRAANKAGGFLGLGKVLGGLVKAVAVAAAAAASACTGGAGAALAIAGLALMLGADKIADVAVKLGVISQADAKYLAVGLQIAGALLSMGSGLVQGGASAAGGAVSSGAGQASRLATQQGVQALETLAKTIAAGAQVVGGGNAVAMAVVAREQASHDLTAKRAEHRIEHLQRGIDDDLGELREIMAAFARVAARFAAIREARGEARLACVKSFA